MALLQVALVLALLFAFNGSGRAHDAVPTAVQATRPVAAQVFALTLPPRVVAGACERPCIA